MFYKENRLQRILIKLRYIKHIEFNIYIEVQYNILSMKYEMSGIYHSFTEILRKNLLKSIFKTVHYFKHKDYALLRNTTRCLL